MEAIISKLEKTGERLPEFIPQWIKRRVETDIYLIYDFIEKAAQETPPSALVLDAGAGEGRFKDNFSQQNYVGCDLAVGDVDWDYSRLDVINNLSRLPFADNLFDVVICAQVLEHVAEPQQVINEMGRVLKPNGRLYLTAPQSWCQHQKPYDFFRYTSYGLNFLFENARLQSESIQPMGGYFWFLSFQLQNINFWLFPRSMRRRKWTWPIRVIFGVIFQLITPLFLYYLDPLDKQKDETFGHLCVAIKE
jgi:SAM-dependent methyltransferase